MPMISLSEAAYARLASRADIEGTSIDVAVERLASELPNTPPLPASQVMNYAEWKSIFDSHMQGIDDRADRYPLGHVTDVSRESMYEGCGE